MTVETIDDAAADWTSNSDSDDLTGVSFFLEEENPRTKFDLLACVCSFVVERLEKRNQKLKKADELPSSPRSVLCFLADPPKKKRSKRPRSPVSESELINPYTNPPLKKKLNGSRIDFFPVGLREQIEKMNGREILVLGEKALTDSDVNSSLSRLMMPVSHMINGWNFLSDEENAFLKIKNGNKWNGIKVSLIEPCGESSNVTLRRWEMMKDKSKGSSSVSCVLTSGWNQVVWRNQLKSGNIVQLWSFRVGLDLHLALLLI